MIRGKTRIFGVGEDTPPSGLGIKTNIHNKFEIEVKDVTTGEVRQTGKAENIILDQYWSVSEQRAGQSYTPGYYIAFGTGTGSISPDRTTMFNQLDIKAIISSSKTVQNNRAEKYTVFSGEIELLPSEYVGAELTEVGLFSGLVGSTTTNPLSLSTHALLKDANNNPISIVKKSTDLITIKASVYLHYPYLDFKTSYIQSGMVLGSLLPVLPEILISTGGRFIYLGLGGMSYITIPSGNFTFDSANKKTTVRVPRAQTTGQNDAPITKIALANGYIQLVPEELYSDITNEVVGVGDGINTGFSTYFPFPMNAVVKMDGVVIPDATVHQTYGTSFPTLAISSFFNKIFENGDLAFPANNSSDQHAFIRLGTSLRTAGDTVYYENTYPDQGIYRIRLNTNHEKFISDDLENWVSLGTASTIDIPEEYQNFRFFKFTAVRNDTTTNLSVYLDTNSADNIIFNTPPPEGAVIEVDYTFPGIAKDSNHVLDMEIEVSFGEHEE